MFRLLPWSSALGGNKVMAEDLKMLASPPSNALLPQLKRKRSDSDSCDAPATKREPKQEPAQTQPTTNPSVDVDKLRETLEAQLSLEVLLKHNELRLIDQEIAKCQVSLEQLRRCGEIPYPGATGLSQEVSNGTGMAVQPGNGAPLSPAPWGVADGPYTRHYAKWLLPDPRFDGGEEPMPVDSRSTRGNPDVGFMAQGHKSRPSRGSGKLQALPNGYPAPKERAGPMIIRRKSDNVLVKLVCLDCRRDNFSSTQGFINHCRIAHNRNFASHDAAAAASGEPVEVDDAGAVVGKTEAPAAPGFVHPLVRSAHVNPSTPSARDMVKDQPVETPIPRRTPTANASFMASPATPHLSSLIKDRGVGLDLEQLVGDAKTRVDLGYEESEEEPDTPAVPDRALGRQPMRTVGPARPSSSKGKPFLDSFPRPYTSPYPPQDEVISPNTIESNQAPSLVSDDDDCEVVSDSDQPSSSEAGDNDQEFSHIDVEDEEAEMASTSLPKLRKKMAKDQDQR